MLFSGYHHRVLLLLYLMLCPSVSTPSQAALPRGGVDAALDLSRPVVQSQQNISNTIEQLLNGYDIRLRPQFGGQFDTIHSGGNMALASRPISLVHCSV